MRFSITLVLACSLAVAISRASVAQTAGPAQPPKQGRDGLYEVAPSDLKILDSSPKMEFPREMYAYEVTDTVSIVLAVSAEGKVTKAKVTGGRIERLKEAAEKTVKKWGFQPYSVNGVPVPVRTEITFIFDNTFDHYRDPDGDTPVPLDWQAAHALIVKSVAPNYPPDARTGRIQGPIELRVIVGKDGHVQALHIIKGHPMLAPAAYTAVRQWEFKPYVVNGKALPVDTKVTVNFTL